MARLTERNSMGIAVYTHEYLCERCNEPIYRLSDITGEGSPTERLAEYEELEEQGLLLRLPELWMDVFQEWAGENEFGLKLAFSTNSCSLLEELGAELINRLRVAGERK